MNYYPYFYARQAELRAVEITAGRFGSPQQVWPLFEAVDQPTKLARTLTQLTTAGLGAYVVMNPNLGRLATPAAQTDWGNVIGSQVAASTLLRPTLKEGSGTTAADVASFAAAHVGSGIGLILTTNKLNVTALMAALAGASVTLFATTTSAYALANTLGVPVAINDNFRAQARNSDYAGVEWLGNNHVGQSAPGSAGFSDYTVLPSTFTPGGGPVGAAAIHLTYREPDDSFWVQHFVSDETDRNVGTFQSKLLEAIAHLDAQVVATPNRFQTTPPIATYLTHLASGTTTSPSMNKTLQVSHHLHVAATYLGVP